MLTNRNEERVSVHTSLRLLMPEPGVGSSQLLGPA